MLHNRDQLPKASSAYRAAAVRSQTARGKRLDELRGRSDGIRQAVQLTRKTLRVAPIVGLHLPHRFIHWPNSAAGPTDQLSLELFDDVGSAPTAARAHRRHGEALRCYLTMTFLAHVVGEPSRVAPALDWPKWSSSHTVASWCGLLGYGDLPKRPAMLRLARAIKSLEALELVETQSAPRDPHLVVQVLDPSGGGHPLRVPGPFGADRLQMNVPKDRFRLGSQFFTNGWHLTLTSSELVTYLMLLHASQTAKRLSEHRYFFIGRDRRLNEYRISDETYYAHRELTEFGLVSCRDNGPARQRGRVLDPGLAPRPFRFSIVERSTQRNAVAQVLRALDGNIPAPHLRQIDASSPARATRGQKHRATLIG